MKDAQELLRKVDSDLNQKYSPDFKDRYQIELLLRELDVSAARRVGPSPTPCLLPGEGCVVSPGHSPPHPGPGEGSGQVPACGAGAAEARAAGGAPQVPPGDAPQAHPRGGAL